MSKDWEISYRLERIILNNLEIEARYHDELRIMFKLFIRKQFLITGWRQDKLNSEY